MSYNMRNLEEALIKLHKSGETEKAKIIAAQIHKQRSNNNKEDDKGFIEQAGDLTAEAAAGFNRAALGAADFFGTNTINAVSEMVGSDFRVPKLSETLVPEQGAFAGENLPSRIAATAGEGAGMGVSLSGGFSRLAQEFGEGTTKKIMQILGGEGALSEASYGAVSGAGQAIGEEIEEDYGGGIGAVVAPVLAATAKVKISPAQVTQSPVQQVVSESDELIDAARKKGVDLLATDVYQPKGWAGNAIKRAGSQLGMIGTGGKRVKQQAQREAMVSELSSQYGVDLDDDVFGGMINSLNSEAKKMKKRGGDLRAQAFDELVPLGAIPLDKTNKVIDDIVAKEGMLKTDANKSIIDRLSSFKSSSDGADFQVLTDLRSNLISDIRAIDRGEIGALPGKSKAQLVKAKKAIDADMKKFAQDASPNAAKNWEESNKIFAEGYGRLKDTELKNIMIKGQTTPEVLMSIFSKARPSELKRLMKSMDSKGKDNARTAVIADMFEKAGYTTEAGSPNRLLTQLNKPKNEKMINILFDGESANEIKGIRKVLEATKEAQNAELVTPTGQNLMIPFGAAVGLDSTGVAITSIASVATISRAYESMMIRKALSAAGRAKKGTPAETSAIREAEKIFRPAVISQMLSAKEEE